MSDLKTECLFTVQDLKLAWERVNASVGSDTKDYFGISIYSSDVDKYLTELHEQLTNNKYEPKRPFKYYEPKKCGTQRTKTVLVISDAIIYQAIADKIAFDLYGYLFETRNHIYGSVLNENVIKGVELLKEEEPDFYFFEYYVSLYNRFIEGISTTLESETVEYKLETDITGFFDCIPHSTLMLELLRLGIDKNILDLLATCLNSWSGTREMPTFEVGIPQGPAASFLLANIILDGLDRLILNKGLNYFRFMDDIRIYGENQKELLSTLALVDRFLKGRSLSINTSKTIIKPAKDNEDDEDLFLDSYGIPLENKIEDTLENNIVIQDETQLKQGESSTSNLSNKHALILYRMALTTIENELEEIYFRFNSDSVLKPISKQIIRKFLTLSQRWRLTVKAIKSIQQYSPRQELVKVWLFGIKHIFWKTNSMIWNLKLYDSLESFYSEFEDIQSDFEHFEWVKYQVLNIYSKVICSDITKQQKAIKDLEKEESPLVRLGYYSILVESIKTDSKLFDSLSVHLKEEKDEYVKESVLNLIHQQHLNVSIDNLKDWFL